MCPFLHFAFLINFVCRYSKEYFFILAYKVHGRNFFESLYFSDHMKETNM